MDLKNQNTFLQICSILKVKANDNFRNMSSDDDQEDMELDSCENHILGETVKSYKHFNDYVYYREKNIKKAFEDYINEIKIKEQVENSKKIKFEDSNRVLSTYLVNFRRFLLNI
jgi:hypothetical protein